MRFSEIKRRIVDHNGRHWYSNLYCICNEFGPIAFVWADNESVALDEAIDAGKLDSEKMSSADYQEYSDNGWDDSYILAGNASEPFWCEYLSITIRECRWPPVFLLVVPFVFSYRNGRIHCL